MRAVLAGKGTRCAGAVESYSVLFSLDSSASNAWPVLGDDLPHPDELASSGEFNFRILGSALNIPGALIGPTDPGTGFGAVDYRLDHIGAANVCDAQFAVRPVNLPSGSIRSGNARIGGGPLMLPLVGDELASVGPYLASELNGRPPGGTFKVCDADDVEVYLSLLKWVRNEY
jgi:hypothetical protein